MADTKRNDGGGKVAAPKNGGGGTQAVGDTLEALGKAIGARIKLTTAAPHSQTYEGTLFTACPILNIVAINTRQGGGAGDFHLIPISRIQSSQIVSLANAPPASVGPVDTKRLLQREEKRVRELKEERKNMGKGVTKEAQAIFDSFNRINLPIRWHNQEMIVHEAVIIAPPYRVEDCKGPKDKQDVLIRVKKVLEGEKRKLKEKEERERKAPAAATGPRKGG